MVLEGFATSFLFSMGVMSWQDSLHVSDSTRSTSLRSTSVVSSIGVTGLKTNLDTEYALSFHLFAGKAQGANAKSAAGSDLEYSASGIDVLGAALAPQYSYRLAEGVFIGAGVPVVFRRAAYPAVSGTSYSLDSRFKILAGFDLSTRIERGDFFLGQRVGFLQLPNSFSWGVELGWRF